MNEKIKAYYVADDIDEVLNYIDNLQQENEQLKTRIEKAIEFLEPFAEWDLCTLKGTMLKKPLEILKCDKEN